MAFSRLRRILRPWYKKQPVRVALYLPPNELCIYISTFFENCQLYYRVFLFNWSDKKDALDIVQYRGHLYGLILSDNSKFFKYLTVFENNHQMFNLAAVAFEIIVYPRKRLILAHFNTS